jgi:heme-degrading monooxygenase HmoA
MYVSILTGRVAQENWEPLESSFEREVKKKPPHGLVESFLIQSEDDPAAWQVVSVWDTKADYKEFEPTEKADVFVELLCHESTVPHRHGYVTITHFERV